MRKRILSVLLVVLAIGLFGCGSKAVDFDVKSLANDLKTKIEYEDEPQLLDADFASNFIDMSSFSLEEGVFYEGSGATAEEIVVLKCTTEDDAANAENALKVRVSEQIENFTDYVPSEVPRLNDAVIVRCGKYVVLSVSKDSEGAKAIIDGYMK